MAQATLLGYPRIGPRRELKFITEKYWKDEVPPHDVLRVGEELRLLNLGTQKQTGMDFFITNDFSHYDHVLDMSCLLGVVPARYCLGECGIDLKTYFAMARGVQQSGEDVVACEMTKWFDTNYHYIVPEFERGQKFKVTTNKPVDDYLEAKGKGYETRPVLIGPVSYLLLGKDVSGGSVLDHLDRLLEPYSEIIARLYHAGARWIQLDEPYLVTDLDDHIRHVYENVYKKIRRQTEVKLFVTTPYGALGENLKTATSLPVDAIHVDLVRGKDQLDNLLAELPEHMTLAMGVVGGRNVWRNNLEKSMNILERAANVIGKDRIWVCPSSSLLHVPYDLTYEKTLDPVVRNCLAFAKQKLEEVSVLTRGLNNGRSSIDGEISCCLEQLCLLSQSEKIYDKSVRERMTEQPLGGAGRASPFDVRRKLQENNLSLPIFPTTTIGSFPQTAEVRKARADLRKGCISKESYSIFVKEHIEQCIKFQESIGLDVLVHGEFERNDMVEFFAEKLRGFAFTENGWVQSYGTRGVKPPIIYGDVLRIEPMTVDLTTYAQSLTSKPVKGMLTGPVTILQWSFVREDQPLCDTAHQIALALQDEVLDLEAAGIKIIQIDEPAFREGMPLRITAQKEYFSWAVQSFRLSSTGLKDETQVHTHMCYSDFNNIIEYIRDLDADVISIETSRSQMELLDAFVSFKYPNEIGPGVYDIHSPRVPSEQEMIRLVELACDRLAPWQIWINPDCGLKTRDWPETRLSLSRMVAAAKSLRSRHT